VSNKERHRILPSGEGVVIDLDCDDFTSADGKGIREPLPEYPTCTPLLSHMIGPKYTSIDIKLHLIFLCPMLSNQWRGQIGAICRI
jgi:hypothetical protein